MVAADGTLTAGAILMLLQTSSMSCVRWSGTPQYREACLEKGDWPLVAGGITLGAGLIAVLFASILSAVLESHVFGTASEGR